jgi:hypothetical protein
MALCPVWKACFRAAHGTTAFRREVGDGEHAEIVIAERVYRVRITELG